MKRFNLTIQALATGLIVFWVGSLVNAQEISRNQVPSVVVNEFQKRFPKAVDVDWETENGVYEVEFEVNRLDHQVWFDKEGHILKQKEEIRTKSLPASIRSAVRQRHGGYRIAEVDKLTRHDTTVYKLEIRSLFRDDVDIFIGEDGKEVAGFLWD